MASKSLNAKDIAGAIGAEEKEVESVLRKITEDFNRKDSGITVILSGDKYRMASNPKNADGLSKFLKYEIKDELTKAQLESLTVIAYRGPITKPELEQIRGVNCAVILRNLLVRGLIYEQDDPEKTLPVYQLSSEAMAQLGIGSADELPEFDKFSNYQFLENQTDI